MKTCGNCGQPYRKGERVQLVEGSTVRAAIVCQPCARLATPLLLKGDVAATCDACGENRAKLCAGCVGELLKQEAAAQRATIEAQARKALGGPS